MNILMGCFIFKLASVLIHDVQLKNNRFLKKLEKNLEV